MQSVLGWSYIFILRPGVTFILHFFVVAIVSNHPLRVILRRSLCAAHATSRILPTSTNTHGEREVGGFVSFRLLYVIDNRFPSTLVKTRWKLGEYKLNSVQKCFDLQFQRKQTPIVPGALTRKCEWNLKKAVNRPPTNRPFYTIPGCFIIPGTPWSFL